MKYLLILLLTFAFINPALAANTVKGSVPKLQPLQPLPAGVSPGYGKNIQYQDPNYIPNSGGPSNGPSAAQTQPAQNPVPGQTAAITAVSAHSNGANHFVLWLVLLLALALLGFLVYKKSKSK